MTTAYGATDVDPDSKGSAYSNMLPYIPLHRCLRGEVSVTVDFVRSQNDVRACRKLLNDVIQEGMSWPFEHALSESDFRNYFFSHTALVVRATSGKVLAAFYCKPNFPGRCSDYCNGGFITDPAHRRLGIATFMGEIFLRVAKDLGFRAVLFNLVFTSNIASIRLWEKLGFTRLATLPAVGHMQIGIFDAFQYYYDLQGKHNIQKQIEKRSSSYHVLERICTGAVLASIFAAGRLSVRYM